MTEQNEGSRPARRRVVRKAAAPTQTPPSRSAADSPSGAPQAAAESTPAAPQSHAPQSAAPTLDLGAELAELAAPKRSTRARKAPVKAVGDIVVPGRGEEADAGRRAAVAPPAADAGAPDAAPSDSTPADVAAPAKRTARKRATKSAGAAGSSRSNVAAGTNEPVAADSVAADPAASESETSREAPAARTSRSRRGAASREPKVSPEASVPASDVESSTEPPAATSSRSRRGTKSTARNADDARSTGAARSTDDARSEGPSQPTEAATASGTATSGGSGSSPRLATTAVLFQAPDPSLARTKRRRVVAEAGSPAKVREQVETVEDDELLDATQAELDENETALGADDSQDLEDENGQDDDSSDDDSNDDDSNDDDSSDDDSAQSDGSSRRRRRRGGRGRRSKGSSDSSDRGSAPDGASTDDSDSSDSSDDDDDQSDSTDGSDDNGDDESSSRRRRRRRSRTGRSSDSDDSRSPRSDEVTALRGSTRLEAKRQRRREGRDAGRRRQVLTEAEFLARRESVERSMVVRESNGRTQIGVLEDGVLAEHYVSRTTQASMVGNVYLGRVQNVLPSMEAAFVDVGKGRNAVLYAGEVNWDAAGLEGQPRRIETALKSGDSVLVQVTKDPIGHKGARLTSQVTLAGRYLVFVPGAGMTGISRKLPEKERARLKKLLREIVPENSGVIVRTAAEGASEEELRADIARLTEQWAKIEKKAKTASAPALLQGEADLAIRVVRDIFNDDFSTLVVQGEEAWDTISGYVTDLAPDLVGKISRWTGEKDVFAEHRIDEQIAKAMDRKVWLPSGGSLVIDRTEAMTVVDVNTGKFTGTGGTLEETVTRNNLEAAEEIVRQLRLRDIGGIIVIDFIDMVLESNRDLVLRRLVECLGRDRTKHQVAEVTSLGLVQMTRKRVGQGLLEAFSEPCEHCAGRGYLVHEHPVDKGGQPPQSEESAEPKKARRTRKSSSKESTPHAPVPVLPAERDKVNATLATIAAAAAHAHENEIEAAAGLSGDRGGVTAAVEAEVASEAEAAFGTEAAVVTDAAEATDPLATEATEASEVSPDVSSDESTDKSSDQSSDEAVTTPSR